MTTATSPDAALPVLQPVLVWRRQQLERAGYPPQDACRLAERADVDLHVAINLLRDGCPAEVALRIVL